MAKRSARPCFGAPSFDPAEAFFSRLPTDCLTEYEDELLAALQALTNVMLKWFPRSVSLQEWAERRIPPDLASSVNGSGIVFVAADCSHTHQDGPDVGSHHDKRRRTQSNVKIIKDEGWKSATQHGRQGKPDEASFVGEHQFNETAPESQTAVCLSYEEENLREIILQCLKKSECRQQGFATFTQLKRWPRVHESFQRVLQSCQHKYRDLSNWAESRGQKCFVLERLHGETRISAKPLSEEEKHERHEDLERFRDRFFQSLPDDKFLPEEDTLRSAILQYVDNWAGKGPVIFQKMCEEPSVRNARYACVPPICSLVVWCERRMGEELQFERLEKGGYLVTRVAPMMIV